MEFNDLEAGVRKMMDQRGVESLSLGEIGFSRGLQGQLFVSLGDGQDRREFPLDRMPPADYLRMQACVESYGRISQDGLGADR